MSEPAITQVGNPVIRAKSRRVDPLSIQLPVYQELILKLKKSLKRAGGVGIAAPQIGVSERVFLVHLTRTKFRPHIKPKRAYAVFNPEIMWHSKETSEDWEGCLSVAEANLFAKVRRSERLRVKFLSGNGETVIAELTGLEARIFQHEMDHLEGQIFLDHRPDPASFMSASEYRAMRLREVR